MKKRTAEEVLNSIKEIREARGWSVARLARESGVPDSTIRSWYERMNIPTMTTLEPVCRALGTPVTEMLGLDDGPVNITADQKLLLYKWDILIGDEQAATMHVIDQFIASAEKKRIANGQ